MKHRVLVVEDEKNAREGLGWFLEGRGFEALLATDGESALKLLRQQEADLVLTDLKMPGLDGMQLLKKIQQSHPGLPVIMITAHGTVETAVEAMKHGAVDYIHKPVILDELAVKLDKVFRSRGIERENEELRRRIDERYGFQNILGRSPAMERVFAVIRQAAGSAATILITGESGTGKELVAGAIHHNSPRKNQPYIKVNCGAMSPTLLESELFGHEKGAFTGAQKQRSGRFELADGGTILLDEVSETSPDFQVKLLRVLQEGEFERVGGQETLKCDVRVLAATNRELEQLVAENKFREDLYYRLNVIRIHLPPLRERQEDIALLAQHFIAEACAKNGRPKKELTPAALNLLLKYHWPGNVRELANVLEAAVVLAPGKQLTPELLGERVRQAADSRTAVKIPAGATLRDAEREIIRATLAQTNNNRAKSARILGIGRKTLYRKLEEYGLE